VTSASGRFVRLGTVSRRAGVVQCFVTSETISSAKPEQKCHFLFQASMLSQPDGPFINVPKLNLAKYAQRQNLAKVKYVHQAKAPMRCFPKLLAACRLQRSAIETTL
jgi:tetratricopeptide repeat protein 8